MDEESTFDFEDLARLSRATSFQYFKTMNTALEADAKRYMNECLRLKAGRSGGPLGQEDYAELGFWYRGLARELLTYIEGLLYVMRRLVVHAEERGEIQLSSAESAPMREVEYFVNVSRKKIEEKQRHNRFLENFILAFRFFPQVLGSSFDVDYSTHGWEKMQRLVKMRNSLTHPKSVEDTLLSPEMPNVISDAAVWFFTCMHDLMGTADVKMLEQSFAETARMPEIQKLLANRRKKKKE